MQNLDEIKAILENVKNKSEHYLSADKKIEQLLKEQEQTPSGSTANKEPSRPGRQKIAVIGLACRLPEADNIHSFWKNLSEGRDSVTEIPADRWKLDGFFSPGSENPETSYSKWGGFINNVTRFKWDFFDFTENEALLTDPQQLLSLEVAWEAFEHAGYGSKASRKKREGGVFWGARGTSNTLYKVLKSKKAIPPAESNDLIGTAQNMIAARISDFLNLTGPGIMVDTACSSSLVAIHLACQSIGAGECEYAVVGGVDLLLTPEPYIRLSKSKAISPQGRCFTLDKRANGYVPGEGCGAVLLKPYDRAVEDNDYIYALIEGSAINNDGHTMGLTTPNLEAQKKVLEKSLKNAGAAASSISYVEVHGTGTTIGDPIEIKALTEVYRSQTDRKGYCGIGSVKTNIGHLHCASGIASFIKVVLSLHHKTLVPTLHCDFPNPRFDLINLPFYPVSRTAPWPLIENTRRASISAFGFGGTNCNIVLCEENGQAGAVTPKTAGPVPFVISAESAEDFKALLKDYIHFFKEIPEHTFYSAVYTAVSGRERFSYKRSFSASSKEDLVKQLEVYQDEIEKDPDKLSQGQAGKAAFMFTGQGNLYPGVLKTLPLHSPVFTDSLNSCQELLANHLEKPLLWYLTDETDNEVLKQTAINQPVIFSLEYALARFWLDKGVKPAALIGHSLGEYTAAVIAGVFTLKEGLEIIIKRSQLMQSLPANGKMAAVFASPEKVSGWINGLPGDKQASVSIAGINGPENTVISGETETVKGLIETAAAAGINAIELNVSHAYHSPLMQGAAPGLKEIFAGITMKSPKIPIISNLSGKKLTAKELSADYWADHLLNGVQFYPGIQTLLNDKFNLFLEIGPDTTLTNLVKRAAGPSAEIGIFSSLQKGETDWNALLEAGLQLFNKNLPVDFVQFMTPARKTEVPGYPLQIAGGTMKKGSDLTIVSDHIDGIYEKKDNSYFKIFNPRADRLLGDHIVQGNPVLPAVAQWTMAVTASGIAGKEGDNPFTIKDILHVAPVLSGENQGAVLKVSFPAGKTGQFNVEAWSDETNRFEKKSEGSFELQPGKPVKTSQELADLGNKIKQAQEINVDQLYANLTNRGLVYKDFYRAISSAWKGQSQALVKLDVSRQKEFKNDLDLYPALLDGAFQGISIMLQDIDSEAAYVPFHIARISFFKKLPPVCLAYSTITKTSPDNSLIYADIHIFTEEGTPLAFCENFCLKKAAESPAVQETKDSYFTPRWIHSALKKETPAAGPANYIVFCQPGSSSHDALLAQIKNTAAGVVSVYPGENFKNENNETFYLNPKKEQHYTTLCEQINSLGAESWNIVHLWTFMPLNGTAQAPISLESVKEAQFGGSYSIIFLLKALHSAHLINKVKIAIVSADSQASGSSINRLHVENSPVYGILQTVPYEFANLLCKHIDLTEQISPAEAFGYIKNELDYNAGETFVSYRDGTRYVRQIQKSTFNRTNSAKNITLKKGSTYLITGGLGEVGLRLAEYIAFKTGGNFVLTTSSDFPGRNEWAGYGTASPGSSPRILSALEVIKRIESTGSRVSVIKADVTSEEDMQKCREQILSEYGALNMVIHAAGVLADKLLVSLSLEDFQKVLFPKMAGALVLSRVFDNDSLDAMVLFSGFVTYVGIVGQSNHAAADYFLDSFAYYREHILNKRTIVINWGIWGDIGIVADEFYIRSLKEKGYYPLNKEEGFAAFETILGSDTIQTAFAKVDHTKVLTHLKGSLTLSETEGRASQLARLERALSHITFTASDLVADREFGYLLQRISSIYVFHYFQSMGLFTGPGQRYSFADVMKKCDILDFYTPLATEMVRMVREENFIEEKDGLYSLIPNCKVDNLDDLISRFDSRFTEAKVYLHILKECFPHYPDILSGNTSPIAILFPAASISMLEDLYHLPSPHHNLAAECLVENIKNRKTGQTVKILEIGGGTGSFTSFFQNRVGEKAGFHYCFTDISPVLVNKAKDKFQNFCDEYRVLDVENDLEGQNYVPGSYDYIAAVNVLHATKSLRNTFSKVRRLLKPGGVLIMLETTIQTRFADLVFGLTRGWWEFEACDLRDTSVLLTHEEWIHTFLNELHFEKAFALPFNEEKRVRYPFTVLVAEKSLDDTCSDSAEYVPLENKNDRIVPGLSGKISDKKFAKKSEAKTSQPAAAPAAATAATIEREELFSHIKEYLINTISGINNMGKDEINPDLGFIKLGVDSLSLVSLTGLIDKEINIKLYPTLFFEYQTINELGKYLEETFHDEFMSYFSQTGTLSASAAPAVEAAEEVKADEEREKEAPVIQPASAERVESISQSSQGVPGKKEKIALIGMAGILPGSLDLDEYWNNLINQVNCVREIDNSRWEDVDRYYSPEKQEGKTYSKWAGLIDGIDTFDAGFFHISPKEAKKMDPQQRKLLEVTHKALENAGYTQKRVSGTNTGVFLGVSNHHYYEEAFDENDSFSVLGTQNGMAANRLSYFYNLNGPSVVMDTQCSSSLVSLHFAINSLQEKVCDMAIVGGANLMVPPEYYILLSKIGALSPDGACKTFDAGANGFVSGEGVCSLVLKPLDRALEDGDPIHAVFEECLINHDGLSSNVSAPNAQAQAKLISRTLQKAQLKPEDISYIETHGTGTSLGDPVEVQALTKAFREFTDKKNFCGIGSVKSNIGHTEACAGMAGLIKVILSMEKEIIPPTIHFKEANPYLNLSEGPFFIVNKPHPWKRGTIRRAGVSAFGMGGANAHVIVRDYTEGGTDRFVDFELFSTTVFTISAKTEEALEDKIKDMEQWLQDNPDRLLTSVCFTANAGRNHYNHRLALICNSLPDLQQKLQKARTALKDGGMENSSDIFYKSLSPLEEGSGRTLDFSFDGSFKGPNILSLASREDLNTFDTVHTIATAYVEGAEVNWRAYFGEKSVKIANLPLYPFAKTSYWSKKERQPKEVRPVSRVRQKTGRAVQVTSMKTYAHTRTWEKSVLTGETELPGNILLLGGTAEQVQNIETGLISSCTNLVHAGYGSYFQEKSDSRYMIEAGKKEDYSRLLAILQEKSAAEWGIIHLEGLSGSSNPDVSAIEETFSKNLYSLFYLAKSLAESDKRFRVLVLTAGAFGRGETEPGAVYKTPSVSFTGVLPYELQNTGAKAVDFQTGAPSFSPDPAIVAAELKSCTGSGGSGEEVLYKGTNRFRRVMTPLAQEISGGGTNTLSGGVFLLTGGLGGLGSVVTDWLCENKARALVIVGRENLGARDSWTVSSDNPKKARLAELEKRGINIHYYSVDITSFGQVKDLKEKLTAQNLTVDGIFHMAGSVDSVNRSIRRKELEGFKKIITPKIHGTAYLFDRFGSTLDFFVLFSSIAGLHGKLGIGLSDYAVANAFEDEFAAQKPEGQTRIISLAWPLWKETGLGSRKAQGDFNWPISKEEGIKILDYAVLSDYSGPLAILNPSDEKYDLTFFNESNVLKEEEKTGRAAAASAVPEKKEQKPAGVKKTPSARMYKEIEESIKDLLVEFLQLERKSINIQAPFSNYGLDSVIVADMVGHLEALYSIQFHPSDVLEHNTVKTLAAFLGTTFFPEGMAGTDTKTEKITETVTGKTESTQEEIKKDALEKKQPGTSAASGEEDQLMDLLKNISKKNVDVDEALKKYGELE